jgi:hypothetical protein
MCTPVVTRPYLAPVPEPDGASVIVTVFDFWCRHCWPLNPNGELSPAAAAPEEAGPFPFGEMQEIRKSSQWLQVTPAAQRRSARRSALRATPATLPGVAGLPISARALS